MSGRKPHSHDGRVRSFVLRQGRLTAGQKRALEELWPSWGIPEDQEECKPDQLFGRNAPVILEIGFGNGDATWQMARNEPQHDFIGVEVHRPGVGHLLLKIEEHGLQNVRIACFDAVELLHKVPDEALAGVRLFFPDPWPKKRHHKRRIVRAAFVELLAAKIAPQGVFHIATDWQPYAEYVVEVMADSDSFSNLASKERFSPRPSWRPLTKYEQRGQRLGHDVFDLIYQRH